MYEYVHLYMCMHLITMNQYAFLNSIIFINRVQNIEISYNNV